MIRRIFGLSLAVVLGAVVLIAEQGGAKPAAKLQPGIYAHFVTSLGDFSIRLFDKDAPKTVQNFVELAEGKKRWLDPRSRQQVRRPYYNNQIIHRVVPGQIIQGGDPLGTGSGGPGYEFPDEFNPKLRHSKAGIVSMANHGPNTNGGQFFITLMAMPTYNDHYTVFGEVVRGMDTVMKISKVRLGKNSRPVEPVIVKTVKIERVPPA
jgi:peptidyl-prolyl cis-trans isomerase A (cyclophilin A)